MLTKGIFPVKKNVNFDRQLGDCNMKIKEIVSVIVLLMLLGCATNPKRIRNPRTVSLPDPATLPSIPQIVVSNNVYILNADDVKIMLAQYSGQYYYAEDSNYFMPTKANMDVIVPYLDKVFEHLGIHYIAEATDCDDFARLKSELAQMILGQTYQIEASPTIFVIFVKQKFSWAGVGSGGGHAICIYACVNEERNNMREVYVWEPQSTEVVALDDYPNRDQVFYVGKALEIVSLKSEGIAVKIPKMINKIIP